MSDAQGRGRIGGPVRPMVGIYDFSYGPYALGDALTWQMNLGILAAEHGCNAIDEYLVIRPLKPSSRFQTFVTQHNYVSVIDGLLPAFFCSPKMRSLKLIRNAPTFNLFLLREAIHRRPMWPSLWDHLNAKLDFVSHKRINAFWDKHGYLPWLGAPRGYGPWADSFRRTHCDGRFVVAVNVRQSALSVTPANLFRDSPWPEWLAFMRRAAERDPKVLFMVLGGYSEWTRELYLLPNVLIPRAMGLGLAHELALLHRADLFMGTSSGFATLATFCNVPYIITKIQHLFSEHAGIPVGHRHYPFGAENQVLSWETETQDLLWDLFEEIRERLSRNREPER